MENEEKEVCEQPECGETQQQSVDKSVDESVDESVAEAGQSAELTAEIEALIAEAEQRGYKRGINEQLSAQLNRPGLYSDLAREKVSPSSGSASAGGADESYEPDSLTSRFLADIRPGVWD